MNGPGYMAVLLATVSTAVCAGDKWYLVPPTDWYWHTASNWGGSPAGLPTASTTVSITKTGEAVPVQILSGEAYTVKSLFLGESYQGPAYCGHLSVAGALTNVTGMVVGDGGKGLLRIQDGGRVVAANGTIMIGDDENVCGTVVMTNGWLATSQYMRIGQAGTGLVLQTGGKVAVSDFISMGYASGASGAYTNRGGTVAVGSSGISVGGSGQASFYQSGGSVTSGMFRVGYFASGQGEYVNEGGMLTVTNFGYVGQGGLGRMVQQGGRQSFSLNLIIGYEATGSGVYTNAGGYLGVLDVFHCGYKGTGEYVQINGTNALSNGLSLGLETNSTGRYILQTGVVIAAAYQQTFRIGTFGSGSMLLNGGTVSMANGSKLVVRGAESGTGVLRGWGDFAVADHTPYVVNNGLIVADGGGATNDLNLTDFSYATNSLANGATGTNGWYAVNKGRLRYPRAWLTDSLPERGQGIAPAALQNDLVNSIRLSFTGIAASGYLRGELYAADRDDIPPGLPSGYESLIGAWRLPMDVSFGTVSLRVRYDRSAVSETDRVRLYRYNKTTGWNVVGVTDGASEVISTASLLSPVSSTEGYLGWFAVTACPRVGTVMRIK